MTSGATSTHHIAILTSFDDISSHRVPVSRDNGARSFRAAGEVSILDVGLVA